MTTALFYAGLLLGLASVGYLSVALWCVARFRPQPQGQLPELPAASIIKPLCGADARLHECIRSYCLDDSPELQILFGVQDPNDPAIGVVRQLMEEFPSRDISLIVDERLHGANLKVSNLISLMEHARHELVVMSDADTILPADGLRRVLAPFMAPQVAAVTCLYKSLPDPNLASVMGGLLLDDWILPSGVVNAKLRPVDYCFGSLTALRRSALERIGGLAAVVDHVADDYMMGQLFVRSGYDVVLSDVVVDMHVSETWRSLIGRERRWQFAIKAGSSLDHIMTVVTFGLPPTLLILLGPWWIAASLIGLSLVLRLKLHAITRKRFGIATRAPLWLIPLREILCFAIWLGSFFRRRVVWRDKTYRIASGGVMIPAGPNP